MGYRDTKLLQGFWFPHGVTHSVQNLSPPKTMPTIPSVKLSTRGGSQSCNQLFISLIGGLLCRWSCLITNMLSCTLRLQTQHSIKKLVNPSSKNVSPKINLCQGSLCPQHRNPLLIQCKKPLPLTKHINISTDSLKHMKFPSPRVSNKSCSANLQNAKLKFQLITSQSCRVKITSVFQTAKIGIQLCFYLQIIATVFCNKHFLRGLHCDRWTFCIAQIFEVPKNKLI